MNLTQDEVEIKELLKLDLSHIKVVGRGLIVVDTTAIYESDKFQEALKKAETIVGRN